MADKHSDHYLCRCHNYYFFEKIKVQWSLRAAPKLIREVLALSSDQYELTPSSQCRGLPLKSSANQIPSLLRAEMPEEEERKKEREIMPSLMSTLLRWRTHSARTNFLFLLLDLITSYRIYYLVGYFCSHKLHNFVDF